MSVYVRTQLRPIQGPARVSFEKDLLTFLYFRGPQKIATARTGTRCVFVGNNDFYTTITIFSAATGFAAIFNEVCFL